MSIIKIEIRKQTIPYIRPLKTSIGELQSAQNVFVKICTSSGLFGWGEASPTPYITGDSQLTMFETAQQLAKIVLRKDALAVEARTRDVRNFISGESSIRSAFDMALYDIAAKSSEMPLYRFLGGERRELRTDLTIGLQETVRQTESRAKQIHRAGFNAIKLKVGRSGLQDVAHVKAVRDLVGPDIHIRIDANQGWDVPTAIANIKAMEPLNVQYVEQPLAHWDQDGHAYLRRKVDLPICADESVFDDNDAMKQVRGEASDYLNIKLGKSGGINTALKINAIAEAAGKKCMIGCFGETRLGLTAAAHLAMARPNVAFLDLDSAYDLKEDPILGGVTYDRKVGGLMHLPDTPGLGATIDETLLGDSVDIEC